MGSIGNKQSSGDTFRINGINMDIEVEDEDNDDSDSGSTDYPIEMEMDGFRVIHDHVNGQQVYDVYDEENRHVGTVYSPSALAELIRRRK